MHLTTQTLLLLLLPLSTTAVTLHPRQSRTTLTVDIGKKFQSIDGFGFSGAFQRANLIKDLPAERQKYVLDLLFNTTTGAGFTILRNGIGSSPSSQSDWMNTILPTSPGSPSGTPKYVWDGKDSGQLWLSQQAVAYGVKTFYANAWSAPGFMKTNGNDANGGSLCGVPGASCASGDWRQAYANYLVQNLVFYNQSGVAVTHLGFLNEPDLTTSYASMRSTGSQAADFVKILSKTLAANNMSHIGINCCEWTGWNVMQSGVRELISAGVESQVAVFTGHEYTSRLNGAVSTKQRVWQTEYSDLNGGWMTGWYTNGGTGDGWTWANTVHNAMTIGNLNAYLWWEGVQWASPTTNEKLILIDNGKVTVAKRLWAFAQWSRFVRPGAVRVGTSTANGIRASAFLNPDGKLAVQVINGGGSAVNMGVTVSNWDGPATNVTAWLTDGSHDLDATTVQIDATGLVTGSVPARAFVTFLLTKA